jgi:hypothetical protein
MEEEVRNYVNSVVETLLERGYARPNCMFRIEASRSDCQFVITVARYNDEGEPHDWENEYLVAEGSDYRKAMTDGMRVLKNVPSRASLQRRAFNEGLARVIEGGKKLDIDVSALIMALQESTKNLLEAKSG